MHLEDQSCTEEYYSFDVPPITENFIYRQNSHTLLQPGRIVMPTNGEIIYSGAHMHGWEGGRSIRVFKNNELFDEYNTQKSTTNEYVWETKHGPRSDKIMSGDVLEIEAEYQNLTNETLTGAMGMYGFFFAPEMEK